MLRIVVLALALGIALIPRSLTGQEEVQDKAPHWTTGLVTGTVGGTAASALGAAGLCALAGVDAGTCALDGVQYGFLPALAAGYGLSYPDRTTGRGRLRTAALGAAGGLLTVLGVWLVVKADPSVYIASPDRAQFLRATLWGTGVGFVVARFAPPASVQASLILSPAVGVALRFPSK